MQHMLTSSITHVRIRHTGSGRVPARSGNAPVPLRRESSMTFLPSSPSSLHRGHGSSCMIAVNIPVYIFLGDVCIWPCVLAFVFSMCYTGFHLCSTSSTARPIQRNEPTAPAPIINKLYIFIHTNVRSDLQIVERRVKLAGTANHGTVYGCGRFCGTLPTIKQ